MSFVPLTPVDLAIASVLVMVLAACTTALHLGIGRQLVIAAVRTTAQLLLVGLVLEALFAHARLGWVILIAVVMLLVAGHEVMSRQARRFTGWWGFGVGTGAMFVSSFSVAMLALIVVIGPDPWYTPQYAVPLLGMLLGNTMTGIAVALDRLTQNAAQQRAVIEGRLMMGQRWSLAIDGVRREAMRSGMMPTINAMATAGLVSLPGMMTGQILAGAPPVEAVKYQILIMFLIAGGTGFGTMGAIWLGSRRLFDGRERLRLDRLKTVA